MSIPSQPQGGVELLARLWGDTPAGRYLSRATAQFGLAVLVYAGARWILASLPGSASNAEAAYGPWQTTAAYSVDAMFALALLWSGFSVAIGLRACNDTATVWGLPTLFVAAFVSACLAQAAVATMLMRLTGESGWSAVPFLIARVALFIALVVSLVPAAPRIIAMARRAARLASTGETSRAAPANYAEAVVAQQGEPVATTFASARSAAPTHLGNQPLGPLPHASEANVALAPAAAPRPELSGVSAMRCTQCGEPHGATSRFCRKCGAKQEVHS